MGRTFLNKDIFDIISYTKENNVGSTLHSNFNVFNEGMAENLVRSGLTHIYVSIDGASQDVYSQYRVKGNLDNVINNIKILNDIKAKHNSVFPLVTWKYLTFSHNEHQISQAQVLAKSLKVDNYEVFKANPKLKDIYDDADEYRNNEEKRKLLKYQCNSLWQSLYISSNGFVFPCSLAFREKESFGDILNDDLQKIWNNSQYQMARKLFSKEPQIGETPYHCKGCKYSIKASSCFEQ